MEMFLLQFRQFARVMAFAGGENKKQTGDAASGENRKQNMRGKIKGRRARGATKRLVRNRGRIRLVTSLPKPLSSSANRIEFPMLPLLQRDSDRTLAQIPVSRHAAKNPAIHFIFFR